MAEFRLYRLAMDAPLNWNEQMGDAMTNTGGAPVPAIRTALRHAVSVGTFTPVASDSVAERLRLRRQLRSLLNNTPMKLTGFFLYWNEDEEQNGWYTPDQGQLVDMWEASALATGTFKVENFVWFLSGKPRTHRRAFWIYAKDLTEGLYPRDYRRLILSKDFSYLSKLTLSYFGDSVTDAANAVSGQAVSLHPLAAGEDGGACNLAVGIEDLSRVSFEQPVASMNKGQVLVYDRRGQTTAPAKGPGSEWEEVYGPDYPFTSGDVPVLDNGLCRVRYDSEHTPGFKVDVWTGTEWEEQGKAVFYRHSASATPLIDYDSELISASMAEYGENRAVLKAIMKAPSDPASREEVFVTLQRGWSGPKFEVYPALNSASEKVDAGIVWTLGLVDADNSAAEIDFSESATPLAYATNVSTAMGTGHTGFLPAETLGLPTFTGDNVVMIGRWASGEGTVAYGANLAVFQEALKPVLGSSTKAYGAEHNTVEVFGTTKASYVAVRLGFYKQRSQQAMEAVNMMLGANTSETADVEAAGGKAATSTRTSDANAHVTKAQWPNNGEATPVGKRATYRVFARCKIGSASRTLNIYAKCGSAVGATRTTTQTSYVWVDLGSVVASESTLEIHCWVSGGSGTVYVDRIEAFLLEDREVGHGGLYLGGRDLGQSVLVDSRYNPTLTTRST